MKEIITQAPIQVRSDTLDKQERMFPLLVAEAINRINEHVTDQPQARVDVWNAVSKKNDDTFNASIGISRYDFNSQLIDLRYQLLLENYGIHQDGRTILRDDGEDYGEVAKTNIKQLLQSGEIQIQPEQFLQCEACDQIIAPSSVRVERCSCGETEFQTIIRTGIFMDVTDDTKEILKEAADICPTEEAVRLRSIIDNMPSRIQLSKHRNYGIDLTEFDVSPEFVLDPKIALAMFGVVMRELEIGTPIISIQGVLATRSFIPFFLLFDEFRNTKFFSIPKVPAYSSHNVRDVLPGFYFPFLSLNILSQKSLVEQQREAFLNEHYKTVKRFERAKARAIELVSQSTSSQYVARISPEFIGEFVNLVLSTKLREAILLLRHTIYDEFSDKYFDYCRLHNLVPDMEIMNEVDILYHLVYE